MKNFLVTLKFQFPAWDEKNGVSFEVRARTKNEAIKYSKVQAERAGYIGGHVVGAGRATFKAQEV